MPSERHLQQTAAPKLVRGEEGVAALASVVIIVICSQMKQQCAKRPHNAICNRLLPTSSSEVRRVCWVGNRLCLPLHHSPLIRSKDTTTRPHTAHTMPTLCPTATWQEEEEGQAAARRQRRDQDPTKRDHCTPGRLLEQQPLQRTGKSLTGILYT